jgi:hypothetical protein
MALISGSFIGPNPTHAAQPDELLPLFRANLIYSQPYPNLAATPTPLSKPNSQFTPAPGELTLELRPPPRAIGWVTDLDGRGYFDGSTIHAGVFKGHRYYGALQFDLSEVPPGAEIIHASLSLTGLDEQHVASPGTWHIQLLGSEIDDKWLLLDYDTLAQAIPETILGEKLGASELGAGLVNQVELSSVQLEALQAHLPHGVVSLRIDGPAGDEQNLFTWDSGFRNGEALLTQPVLRLVVKPLAEEDYVIITSTPSPENVVTAAVLAATATEIAEKVGTPTPVPPYWITPVIVRPTPTPASTATALFNIAVATAEAYLYGTATPLPFNAWTVTPVPTSLQLETSEQPVTPNPLVIITSTPTPQNIITVAAQARQATAIAATTGTYTPVPDTWVTPIIVTPRPPLPLAGNAATATFQTQLATAEAFLFGRRDQPGNMWTATPTPILIPVNGDIATPWVTPTATPTPQLIPEILVNKIAFLSNRSGGPEPLRNPLVYVIDPDGSNLSVLADPSIYHAAIARDQFSPDQRYRAFVKDTTRFSNPVVPAIFSFDYETGVEKQLTFFGAGAAWDPVWSASGQIAFVSNDTRDDEIWVINADGTGLQRLTLTNEEYNAREAGKDTFIAEQNGHPSWSPDGSRIVFWSNRTGHRQIWVMDATGENMYSLSTTGYDDWDPVWIKVTDPARKLAPD